MAFETCPKCEAPTKYKVLGTKAEGCSLICTRCNWEAAEIPWAAKAVRFDKIEASQPTGTFLQGIEDGRRRVSS